MYNPIVITGYDQISPLGITLPELDDAIARQVSGVTAHTLAIAGLDTAHIALGRAQWDAGKLIAPSKVPMDRCTAMALSVAQRALAQANEGTTPLESQRLGVYWGSGMSGAHTFDTSCEGLYAHQRRLRPTNVVTAMPNAPAAEIALLLQAKGICLNFACACASSAVAIGEAMHALRSGRISVAVVGGSESMLTPGVIASWQAMRVLAPAGTAAASACRPFDSQRQGFALAEGAGALVIETLDHAKQRGAMPLAVLSGYGISSDGVHITNPDVQGQVRAMQLALEDAHLSPSDIGYINAHGTATQAGDLAEGASISAVFGAHGVRVSSTKALHGHLLGASGVVELIISLRALVHRELPRAAHVQAQDPRITLQLVGSDNTHAPELAHVMSNSFAFGGTNAVLIASRYHD